MKNKSLILEGNIYKTIIVVALPLMFSNLIQTVYNLTDTFFISKLGGSELAGVTLVWPVVFMLIALNSGITMAGGAIIAQQYGAGNKKKSKKIAGQLVLFSTVFSIVLGGIGFLFSEKIAYLMGGRGDLLKAATTYLKIISIGAPLMNYSMAYTQIKQGLGDTISPMRLSLITVGINIVLDPLFIFTLDMGVKGAALATLTSRFIGCGFAIYVLHFKIDGLRIRSKEIKANSKMLIELIRKGIPLSIGSSVTSFGFIILNTFVIKYGEATMAGFGIGNRIVSLVVMPLMGIGGAMSIIVGQNLGNENYDRIREGYKKSIILIFSLCIPFQLFLYNYAGMFIGFFTKEDAILEKGTAYLQVISFTVVCLGLFQLVSGILQGLSQSKKAMWLSISRLWIFRIPLIMTIPYFLDIGEYAIWYAMATSNLVASLVALVIFMSIKINKIKMVQV